jgi:hypothetical protein
MVQNAYCVEWQSIYMLETQEFCNFRPSPLTIILRLASNDGISGVGNGMPMAVTGQLNYESISHEND